jgi:hypothetical protein
MGLARCIAGVSLLVACGGDGSKDTPWTVVAEAQPAALLSVWGSSESDVWVVGGEPADHSGPIVEHYDGTKWTKLDSGQRNMNLWWVNGVAGGPVFMSGTNGTILQYKDGQFTKLDSTGSQIVFGLWAASATDAWAVGGAASGGSQGFVWRFDGTKWNDVAIDPAIKSGGTCWKVNGISANNVWITGTTGLTLHWNGTALEQGMVPTDSNLFSVGANSERTIAVGGSVDGVIFENDGTEWKSAIPAGGPLLSGVTVTDDDAYAVGDFGVVLHRKSGGGWATDKNSGTQQHLHAAWIDPSGGVWSVGGQFESSQTSDGVLIHKGDALQGSFQ